jgi:hypothetical protein
VLAAVPAEVVSAVVGAVFPIGVAFSFGFRERRADYDREQEEKCNQLDSHS